MKIIIGLGNFGKKYEGTRHNAGFMFVDLLATNKEIAPVGQNLDFSENKKFESDIAETVANGEKVILVKPKTYMNASGRAATKIKDFYKAENQDVIVVSDDIDLPIGTVRIRQNGSSGGQKGLDDIIQAIGEDFTRIRIGINQTGERKDKIDAANFVLSKFSKRELPVIEKSVSMAVNYLVEYLKEKKSMPNHTLEVVPKEESPKKI